MTSTLNPNPQSTVTSTASHLTIAREALSSAISLAALDGGMQHVTIRAALLELAAIHAASQDQPRTALCLQLAAAASNKSLQLTLSSHTLSPVSLKELPSWLLSYVRGQEDSSTAAGKGNGLGKVGTGAGSRGGSRGATPPPPASGGKGEVGTAVASGPDADVGRCAVRRFVRLAQSWRALPVGEEQSAAVAQIAALHAALKFACPVYLAEVCFSEVPLPTEPPPTPPFGE